MLENFFQGVLKFLENPAKTPLLFKMAGLTSHERRSTDHFQIRSSTYTSLDICHVRMTDNEGFLTIYGHSDSLLNNNIRYSTTPGAHQKGRESGIDRCHSTLDFPAIFG